MEMNETLHAITVDQAGIYQITVRGRMRAAWSDWFAGMTVTVEKVDDVTLTTLTGPVADQAALHGVIARIRDLGLPLITLQLLKLI